MLKFIVLGSAKDEYEILASRDGDNFRMSCTCEAARRGTYCKHRFGLLAGVVTFVLSGDVVALKALLSGTNVERRYARILDLEARKTQLESLLKQQKNALAREMAL